jgi:cytochrome P450
MIKNAAIPSHVPSQLVHDFDYTDMRGETDVFRHFGKLHDGPDIFYTPRLGGHWVVTRFSDMEEVLGNDSLFSSHHQSIPYWPINAPLLEYDGPKHDDFRKVLAPFFTPKSIGSLEHVARELTRSLINEFYERGQCCPVNGPARRLKT